MERRLESLKSELAFVLDQSSQRLRRALALTPRAAGVPEGFDPVLDGVERTLCAARRTGLLVELRDLRVAYWDRSFRGGSGPDTLALVDAEGRVYSQNGEDGLLRAVFGRIGTTNCFFVEFGVESGEECGTRLLLVKEGWRGVWIEADSLSVQRARDVFKDRPVGILESFVTTKNVLDLFSAGEVPEEPDLLVIDVDGNDYWLWKRIATRYRPRVAMIEVNARITPERRWVHPYESGLVWDRTCRFGASLAALRKLATEFGYEAVCCDSQGVNVIFLRTDLMPTLLRGQNLPAQIYHPPRYDRFFFGHPIDLSDSGRAMEPLALETLRRGIQIRGHQLWWRWVRRTPGEEFLLPVSLRNRTDRVLSAAHPNPIRLGYRWIPSAAPLDGDAEYGIRTPLTAPIYPGQRATQGILVRSPAQAGRYELCLTFVQENVAWGDALGVAHHVPVEVC